MTTKPEEQVRQHVLAGLRQLGWPEGQLQWKPEWPVPDTPLDLTRRERGQNYRTCGTADLVAFADESRQWHSLQVVFELKAPDIDQGKAQLIRHLSSEPMAKMGYWTNGSQSLAVYKRHQADWIFVEGAPLPQVRRDLTQPPDAPPTWNTLRIPTEAELTGALRRLVAATVIGDANVHRREDQLRELLHVLLVKLESDAVAARSANRNRPASFRIYGDPLTKVSLTAKAIREQFREYFRQNRTRIFHHSDGEEILLTDETLFAVVAELSPYRILGDDIDLLAKAFQIWRTDALKSGEGQYLTPLRIVRPAIMALEITSRDKVIDPACGSGSFLTEALRQVAKSESGTEAEAWNPIKWANDNLYGIDKDDIGVKLTRAIMVAMRDGSTHVLLGDAIRTNQWGVKYPKVGQELGESELPFVHPQFTVAVTNPPFGEKLRVSAADCRAAGYTISVASAMAGPTDYADIEIGLVYLELTHRLLRVGGRVGIVLPETYFFSHSYRWLPAWLKNRFELRGMLNLPMEAFEEFCRAKTNFYIFEKVGDGSHGVIRLAMRDTRGHRGVAQPSWFSSDKVMVCTAHTCGLAKAGRPLPKIDPATGKRVQVPDPDTGELVDALDDRLLDDMMELQRGRATDTLRFVPADRIGAHCAVPVYYDSRYIETFRAAMKTPRFAGFDAARLGELAERGIVEIRAGHGSPSHDQRVGEIPYIKVSDLRAGLVNINPTNRVPLSVAQAFWKGQSSGLRAFDLVCPERTSRNIGDFCVLMPGQEQIVMTREIIVLRPGAAAMFDAFYLLWAMTLKIVRDQWNRIVFMQTNREDVGDRFLEIEIPLPPDPSTADEVSAAFRGYYRAMAEARVSLAEYVRSSGEHHFFIGSAADAVAPAHPKP